MADQKIHLSLAGTPNAKIEIDTSAKTCRVRIPDDGSVTDLLIDQWEKVTMNLSLGIELGMNFTRGGGGPGNSGLVSSWPFSTDFTDDVDGNDLTAHGGAAITGGVAVFEAANSEYADCPTADNLQLGSGDWTILGWVKRATTGSTTIVSNLNSAHGLAINTFQSMSSNVLTATVGATDILSGPSTGAVDTWILVALKRNTTAGTPFIRVVAVVAGVLSGTNANFAAGPILDTSANTTFGADPTPANFFNGSLSGWKFFTRELSDAEIQAIYDAGAPT